MMREGVTNSYSKPDGLGDWAPGFQRGGATTRPHRSFANLDVVARSIGVLTALSAYAQPGEDGDDEA